MGLSIKARRPFEFVCAELSVSQIHHFYRYHRSSIRMGRKRSRAGIDAQLDALGIRRIRTPTQLGQTSERFMCLRMPEVLVTCAQSRRAQLLG